MRRFVFLLAFVALIAAACGDDGGSGDAASLDGAFGGDDGSAADLPEVCTKAPFDFDVKFSGVPELASGPLAVETAVGIATPIVPNGDGALDDLDIAGFTELAAQTDLLMYTQWVGDHSFSADDISLFGGPGAPEGKMTLGLTVVPPAEPGLVVGDVVSSTDELAYDSITSFATTGVFREAPEGDSMYLIVNNLDEAQGGTAEILYVDDNWLCVDWKQAGETRDPEGTYTISGVVLTPLKRGDTPFN